MSLNHYFNDVYGFGLIFFLFFLNWQILLRLSLAQEVHDEHKKKHTTGRRQKPKA
jgi:hypothetical protein